jgi:hypothetical protein
MHNKRIGFATAVLVALSCSFVLAENPAKCDKKESSCNANNICTDGAGRCQIDVLRGDLQHHKVRPYINGAPKALKFFCIPHGSETKWVTADAMSKADITFDTKYPFDRPILKSTSIAPFTHEAHNPTADAVCYTFAVSDCKADDTGCVNTDPKVVVTGGGP